MALNATADIELSVDGYCTFSQLQALLPYRTLSNASQPTRNQALVMTRDVFAQINGMLDVLGYEIAVSSGNTTSVRILGRLNSLGAGAQIEASAYSAGNEVRSEHSVDLQEQFDNLMEQFAKGQISLPNATRQANFIHRADEQEGGYRFHRPFGSEKGPTFTKSMNFR